MLFSFGPAAACGTVRRRVPVRAPAGAAQMGPDLREDAQIAREYSCANALRMSGRFWVRLPSLSKNMRSASPK